jgi:hypothetical protein
MYLLPGQEPEGKSERRCDYLVLEVIESGKLKVEQFPSSRFFINLIPLSFSRREGIVI